MSHIPLYPLRFEPIFRRYLWGGCRLASFLNKSLGDGDDYAESWELCDRKQDQSRIAAGPLAGTTLGELVRTRGRELLGRHAGVDSFPLLFKFLDARRNLSIQVHPDDDAASRLDPPDRGKSEAWVVLAADPGSQIVGGLMRGVDRSMLAEAAVRGTIQELVHRFHPSVGDCVYIPPGTVHALGAGVVVAEIQECSDVTYRLFDFNRVGPDGRPRALHVNEALGVIDFAAGPIEPTRVARLKPRQLLLSTSHFVLERLTIESRMEMALEDECMFVAVVGGAVLVESDLPSEPRGPGATWLVPAAVGRLRIDAIRPAELLLVRLPS